MLNIRNRKALILPAVCAAVLAFAMPADAKIEADPVFGDVIVLYSDPVLSVEDADPLCSVINTLRKEKGAKVLTISDELTEQAEKRVGQFAAGGTKADAETLNAEAASETVILGQADANTMISSILLSEQQSKNLFCADYHQIGYACSEDQTIWVLLLTS